MTSLSDWSHGESVEPTVFVFAAKFWARRNFGIFLRDPRILMLLSLSSGFLGAQPGLVAGGEGSVVGESAFEA